MFSKQPNRAYKKEIRLRKFTEQWVQWFWAGVRRGQRNNSGLAHVGDCGSDNDKVEREQSTAMEKRDWERAKHGVVILIYSNIR